MDIATVAFDVKPNVSNSRGWEYYADEINMSWRKGVAVLIQCGQILIDAKAELHSEAFNNMVKTRLAFDRSVGTKLMAIAANPILCAHVHILPNSWGTLYELSQLMKRDAFSSQAYSCRSLRLLSRCGGIPRSPEETYRKKKLAPA